MEENKMLKRKKPAKQELEIEDEDIYTVEVILDKKKIKGKWYYLIKWFNYPESQNTWEPREHLMCHDMVDAFEEQWRKNHPGKEDDEVNGKSKSKSKKELPKPVQELSSDSNESEKRGSKAKVRSKNEKKLKKSKPCENSLIEKKYTEDEERKNKTISKSETDFSKHKSDKREDDGASGSSYEYSKGNIDFNVPKRILSAKLKEDKKVDFLIMWRKKHGFKPKDSWITCEEMKKKKYYDIIIDFYEQRLRFHNDSGEAPKANNSNDSTIEQK